MKKHHSTSPYPLLILGLIVIAAGWLGQDYIKDQAIQQRIVDTGAYLVYVPEGIEDGAKTALVYALSPDANASAMIERWMAVADQRHWIVAASKEFRNETSISAAVSLVKRDLGNLKAKYPINKDQVILTGFSGGGMAAHGVAQFAPKSVRAVVTNCGLIHPSTSTQNYPRGKLAVFLASPTDFNYADMSSNQEFLKSRGWTTQWIEFDGGHALAPAKSYAQAAAWLAEQFQ